MAKLDDYDIDFIREKYPLTEWTIQDIADEIEHPANTVFYAAKRLGIKRPILFKGPDKDWELIWNEYVKNGLPVYKIAEILDMKHDTVLKAVRRMEMMTESERVMRWNRYRTKRGLPLIYQC